MKKLPLTKEQAANALRCLSNLYRNMADYEMRHGASANAAAVLEKAQTEDKRFRELYNLPSDPYCYQTSKEGA